MMAGEKDPEELDDWQSITMVRPEDPQRVIECH